MINLKKNEKKQFSLDMNLDIWKQPEIEVEKNPVNLKGGGWGLDSEINVGKKGG